MFPARERGPHEPFSGLPAIQADARSERQLQVAAKMWMFAALFGFVWSGVAT